MSDTYIAHQGIHAHARELWRRAIARIQGPDGTAFTAWGLSFFFGRTIYTAIEGQSTSGGVGPYFAF